MKQFWIWPLTALLMISAASYGLFLATRPPELPAEFLYGNGHIEGTEIRISSEVTGRVVEQALTEGATVRTGETVVVIEPRFNLDELQAAQGELTALRGSRAALDSQIAVWRHHVETARTQLDRIAALRDARAASEEDVERAADALREAEGQLRKPETYFDARVARVDDYAQFTPRDIHVPVERTRMVYGVTLSLGNPERRLKPGMPANAWIRWEDAAAWPDALPVPRG